MNPGLFSVKHDRVLFVAMAIVLVGGIVAYNALGRLEDPEFTIKEALIVTPYPGASAEEVALEVTNPIEIACQQLGQLERVESESVRGRSIVKAVIRDQYDRNKIPQVWDELRRKVADAQPSLPPSVRGNSMVIDDFGDVYGIFLAVSGEGFTYPELRRYSEFLRRELLLIDNVKKVELFGEQQEQVFLQISRQRLARLGIDEEQIYTLLRAQNVVADGGRVRIGSEHPSIDPEGGFRTPAEMLDLVIGSNQSGRQFTLRDVADIQRGYADPPRRILRFDGQPAIGIGISTIQGGNVVAMGEAVREKLAELKADQPIGIEIGEINFQPEAVSAATGDFVFNLIKAVSIVILVLLLTMGRKTGFIIGLVLFLTIMATFLVMFMDGNLLMERISLGALIIALCMLTDNAIIVIEGVKVRIEAGEDKLEVVRDVVAQNQWPLFGATAIGVLAFAAIAWSEDSTGEYTNSLFWVILISLSLSWLSSVTVTPLLGYLFFKPQTDASASAKPAYSGVVFQWYQKLLILALRNRWGVVIGAVVLFVISLYGFTLIDQSFFPPATRPQFMVDVFLPSSTHIRETEAFADEIEQYVQKQDHVTHVASFVGGGGLRFLLVYSPEPENRAFVQFLVEVDDPKEISKLVTEIQKYLDEEYPDANAVSKKFLLGPGAGGRIQARFQGPDPAKLRELGDQAKLVLQDDGKAIGVRHDWREREKVLRPSLFESQSRRNGLTRVDVAAALQSSLEGRVVGAYREPGDAGTGTGTYPQEARLLPIIARPPLEERSDIAAIDSMQIWSPVAGRMIPLSQVVSDVNFAWEDPIVIRRDRFPTLTVHADPRSGLPSQLFNRVRDKIEAIELPPGYSLEWGGEYEDSGNARAALAEPLPYFLALMVFIVVCLFNSFRVTALIWLIMPLAIIGVTVGLLLTGQPFGFMALLGVLALSGELIKNQIVVISKIETEIAAGKSPYDAILYGGTSKMRPVSMVVLTTVLGMIPLLKDPFFGAMAVCIMFGLSFAAVLSLLVTPVMYAIMYDIHEERTEKA
ncbi:efflux RND transporter permease subunit [Blastopirellula marina]|uniref:AcrB/AcrD/AcrF family protein n=1 Tax=Blastopirellula marina TaxID=124 RepID=A0A2S8FD79_9BACT|nr:efflux RND transporter permease subunit [Blastopirellula marina]PQO30123.1 AcrB/AcrD/AcrF family protein [Blastopirellula marina]PTL42561.1 AcrB/AcrD/AcrF family protein [Blastopirellula marina]